MRSENDRGDDTPQRVPDISNAVQVVWGETCSLNLDCDDQGETLDRGDPASVIRYIYGVNPIPHICKHQCSHQQQNSKFSCDQQLGMLDSIGHEVVKHHLLENRARFFTGRRIAIIGSGIVSLVVGYELVMKGHGVVIYDSETLPGGRLRSLVETGCMSEDLLDDDIDVILSLGVDLRLGMTVGEDLTAEKLSRNFDLVLDTSGMLEANEVPGRSLRESWLWSSNDNPSGVHIGDDIVMSRELAHSIHEELMANIRTAF